MWESGDRDVGDRLKRVFAPFTERLEVDGGYLYRTIICHPDPDLPGNVDDLCETYPAPKPR
jgi:hypothetical protein